MFRRRNRLWIVGGIILLCSQTSADDLMAEAAAKLVARLDDADARNRDAAEAEILRLGPSVLIHLPDADSRNLSAEQKYRLERLLPKLREARARRACDASQIQLHAGRMSVAEMLAAMEKQSGNKIAPQKGADTEWMNTTFEREAGTRPFWPLLDDIARTAKLTFDFSGRNRTIRYAPKSPHPGPLPEGEGMRPTAYHGAFRFGLDRILLVRSFGDPTEESTCTFEVAVQVEPRLEPLQVVVDGSACFAVDDKGRALAFRGPERAYAGFEEGAIQTRIRLPFAAPPRDASTIKRLDARLDVLVPSTVATFQFDSETGLKNAARKQEDLNVTLEDFAEEDEGLWVARLTIRRNPQAEVLDSFLKAMLKNDVYLEKSDGAKATVNGGMNSRELGPDATQFEYLFVDQPGKLEDWRLIVRVPAGFVTNQVPIRLEDLPLP